MISERHGAMIAKALGLFTIVAMIVVVAIASIFALNRQQHSCDLTSIRVGEDREELKIACPHPVDISNQLVHYRLERWSFDNGEVFLRDGHTERFEWYVSKP